MKISVTSPEHVCETCGLFVAQPRHIQNACPRKRADDPIFSASCCLRWGPWRTSHSRLGWVRWRELQWLMALFCHFKSQQRALKLGTRGIPVIDAFTSFYPPHHPMFNRVWNHEINHPFWGVKYPYFWVDTHMTFEHSKSTI